MSCPSSEVYFVSRRPRYCGASAIQTLRAPRSLNTHASFPPTGEAVSSEGKGAEIACSIVKEAADAAATGRSAATASFDQHIRLSLVHWWVSMTKTSTLCIALCALAPAWAAPQADRLAAMKADA